MHYQISISKPKLLAVALIILVASSAFYLGQVLATPSPSIGRTITPGLASQCDYLVNLDGTTPVAQLGTDKGGTPGDNIVGTAGQDPALFINSLMASNEKVCLTPDTYTLQSSIVMNNLVNTTLTCTARWACVLKAPQSNTIILIGAANGVNPSNCNLCSKDILVSELYLDGSAQTTSGAPEGALQNGLGIMVNSLDSLTGFGIRIDDNFVYNTAQDGIYIYSGSNGLWITNNYLLNGRGYWAAIHTHANQQKTIITGNVIRSWTGGCIRHGNIIETNWCFASGKTGYVLNPTATGFPCIMGGGSGGTNNEGTIIADNYIWFCKSDGITAWNDGNVINGNRITANAAGQAFAGINATQDNTGSSQPLRGALITSNYIEGYSIGLRALSMNGTLISNNVFNRTTTPVSYIAPTGNSTIRDNQGYNPVGKFTNPFGTTAWGGVNPSIAPYGTASAPSASTTYRVSGVDVFITSTGGTSVSITIQDNKSNTVASGLTTLTMVFIPVGYTINFGAFSPAPTVTVFGN